MITEPFLKAISNIDSWESLDIDYHPPHVERLWMQDGDYRISLHVIHPCGKGDALLHPHPWQSAIHVLPLGGVYEHGIGYQREDGENVIVSTQRYHKGSVDYEMLEKSAVHFVRPIGEPVYSIMLSGPKIWPENGTEVLKELKPLTEERKSEILLTFKNYFDEIDRENQRRL